VTGTISAQRRRGSSRASAANHTRSAGSYGPGRGAGAGRCSRAAAPATQHPSPCPCGIAARPGRVSGEPAGRRS
jgi:hypothetical protein